MAPPLLPPHSPPLPLLPLLLRLLVRLEAMRAKDRHDLESSRASDKRAAAGALLWNRALY